MKHLLKTEDLTKADIEKILADAKRYYHNSRFETSVLKGKILATLFFEPSTRTKMSFSAAIQKLGGNVIDLGDNSSLKKGESFRDTVKTASQYADIIVIRHSDPDILESVCDLDIPIINAGSGSKDHPTQALTDLATINQYCFHKKDLSIMFTGDLYYSRTVNSLLKILKHTNYNLNLILTSKNKIGDLWYNPNTYNRCLCITEDQIEDLIHDVDILYMTRCQTERHGDKQVKSDFALTQELVYKMKNDSIIMHPFPRNDEISGEVDNDYRAVYFKQIENGLYIRMALLNYLL